MKTREKGRKPASPVATHRESSGIRDRIKSADGGGMVTVS